MYTTQKTILTLFIIALFFFTASLFQNTLYSQKQEITILSEDELRKAAIQIETPVFPPLVPSVVDGNTVKVVISVNKLGDVFSAQAIKGNSLLRDASVKAAMNWKFKPLQKNASVKTIKSTLTFALPASSFIEEAPSIEDYQKMIKLTPDSPEAHYKLGKAYYKKQNYISAIVAYKKAIQIKNDFYSAYYDLAEIYFRQSNFDQAIAMYKKTYEIAPTFVEAYLGVGWSHVRSHNYNKAIEFFLKAAEVRGDIDIKHLAYLNIASLQETSENFINAISTNKQVIALEQELLLIDPTYPVMPSVFARKTAQLCVRIGQKEQAVSFYSQSIELAADEMEKYWAFIGLAKLYESMQKIDSAIEYYQRAAVITPRLPTAHLALGKLHLAKKDVSAAIREYNILKDLDSESAASLLVEIKKINP